MYIGHIPEVGQLALTGVGLTLPALLGYLGCCLAGPAAWCGAMIPLLIAYFYERRKLLRRAA